MPAVIIINRLLLLVSELKAGKDLEETPRGLVPWPHELVAEPQQLSRSPNTLKNTKTAATLRLKQKRQIFQSGDGKSLSHTCRL